MAKRAAKNGNGANLGFEEKPWAAADKLRRHMDASEPILAIIVASQLESRSLATTHDALQPKLLSGEASVNT